MFFFNSHKWGTVLLNASVPSGVFSFVILIITELSSIVVFADSPLEEDFSQFAHFTAFKFWNVKIKI